MSSNLLNAPVDVIETFRKTENIYFLLSRITGFDAKAGSGSMEWQRYGYKVRTSFNQVSLPFERAASWEFPPEYAQDKIMPFDISFVSEHVVRVRFSAAGALSDLRAPSPMIERLDEAQWTVQEGKDQVTYGSSAGSLTIGYDPLRIILRDRSGKVLTQTRQIADQKGFINSEPMPTSFVRSSIDLKRYMALTLELAPGEALIGGGESFAGLNKRGQKLNLWMNDPKGVMNNELYKPVPLLISSSGYGVFVHTSAPVTLDIGHTYSGAQTLYVGDDTMDVFFFLGNPHEILDAYTRLTGKSPVPPLWSFGLWMSRITYQTQEEVLEVARKLRDHRIPCDVIHLDTGWFDVEWRCNYEFSPHRFPNPGGMLTELKEQDFRLCLWQLPYFTPTNSLFGEIVEKGYAVVDGDGNLPTEDAILDFSNPEAVKWYRKLLSKLVDLGVSAIKADFGEGAPLHGVYASGKSGRLEHNLYPLRYSQSVHEAIRRGDETPVLWARSAWAGGQRYPIHWGGDSETSDAGLAATIRGGLSLGSSGFTFWSHDNGGFITRSPEELYLRWLACGMFSSHTRCHGQPPKEPWAFSEAFMEAFREIVNMRYKLMPYIYAQSVQSASSGLPVMRALCIDYPDDPLAWGMEDAYLFGNQMLVAPLLHSKPYTRKVYVPEGTWIDYQSHKAYEGGRCHEIEAGPVPIIVLVQDGAAIPHAPLAQSTQQIDWSKMEFTAYIANKSTAEGLECIPGNGLKLRTFDLLHDEGKGLRVARAR